MLGGVTCRVSTLGARMTGFGRFRERLFMSRYDVLGRKSAVNGRRHRTSAPRSKGVRTSEVMAAATAAFRGLQ